MIVAVVVLRAEIITLRLAFLANQLGMLKALVHVVRNRAHVVEKLRIYGPALVFIKHGLTDESRPGFSDGVAERKSLPAESDVAQPLVGQAAFIGGFGGAGEPAFVNATAISAIGIPIVGMQFDSLAGMQEAARNPCRSQS